MNYYFNVLVSLLFLMKLQSTATQENISSILLSNKISAAAIKASTKEYLVQLSTTPYVTKKLSIDDVHSGFHASTKHSLTYATKHINMMQNVLEDNKDTIEDVELLEIVDNFLQETSPGEVIEPLVNALSDEETFKKNIKDYAFSYMKLAGDLLKLAHIDAWVNITSKSNSKEKLTPSTLLHKVDQVVDYSMQYLDYSDFIYHQPFNNLTDEILLFETSEMKVQVKHVNSNHTVISLNVKESMASSQENVNHENDQFEYNTFTVVSTVYKTLPTLENTMLRWNHQQTEDNKKYKREDVYKLKSPCEYSTILVSETLCDQLHQEDFYSSQSGNSTTKSVSNLLSEWYFPPDSIVISANAYNALSKVKASIPIRYEINYNTISISTSEVVPILKKCVFYNTKKNIWSDYGCKLEPRKNASICYCNHTTNFAMLLLIPMAETVESDIFGPSETSTRKFMAQGGKSSSCYKILNLITDVAGILSLVSVATSIFLLGCARRVSAGRTERNTIHISLAVSIFLLHLVLLIDIFGADPQHSNNENIGNISWFCILKAFLTHYFFLCNFAWMTLEGILLYLNVIQDVLKHNSLGIWKHVIGWSFPCLVALVTLVVGMTATESYIRQLPFNSSKTNNFTETATDSHICYLSLNLWWATILPVSLSLIFNMLITFLVTRIIVRLTKESRHYQPSRNQSISQTNIKVLKKSLTAFCKLNPILGLPWVLGIIASFTSQENACYWLGAHSCLNGTQGVLFFILIIHNHENRGTLRYTWRKCSTSRSIG